MTDYRCVRSIAIERTRLFDRRVDQVKYSCLIENPIENRTQDV
jgi:hypothetical protein